MRCLPHSDFVPATQFHQILPMALEKILARQGIGTEVPAGVCRGRPVADPNRTAGRRAPMLRQPKLKTYDSRFRRRKVRACPVCSSTSTTTDAKRGEPVALPKGVRKPVRKRDMASSAFTPITES